MGILEVEGKYGKGWRLVGRSEHEKRMERFLDGIVRRLLGMCGGFEYQSVRRRLRWREETKRGPVQMRLDADVGKSDLM